MKVFVAGATGAIGRPLVARLVDAGHQVAAMTRTPAKAAGLAKMGADPVVCDALDGDGVLAAVAAQRPEVVVCQLTDLPAAFGGRDYAAMTAATNRLREQGTGFLVDAAVAGGARRVITQSLAFIYAPGPGAPRSEDAPILSQGPPDLVAAARSAVEGERLVLEAEGIEGLALRYGQFYGPGTWFARDGSMTEQVCRRRFPIVGQGAGVFSFVHVDDAAAATVAALDAGSPGVYNVCDDEPAQLREWLPAYARLLNAKPPLRVPKLVARLIAGPVAVFSTTEMVGASNARARRELEWEPRYPSWREGFREALK